MWPSHRSFPAQQVPWAGPLLPRASGASGEAPGWLPGERHAANRGAMSAAVRSAGGRFWFWFWFWLAGGFWLARGGGVPRRDVSFPGRKGKEWRPVCAREPQSQPLLGAAGRCSGRATSVLASGRGVGQPPAARLAEGWAQASGQEGSFRDHAGPCPPSLFCLWGRSQVPPRKGSARVSQRCTFASL